MAEASTFYLSIAIVLVSSVVAYAGGDLELSWAAAAAPTKALGCRGPIAQCLAEGELEMDSEINRRFLATTRPHISYGALQPGTVPCSLRGVSYYNCKPGAEANPYSRPCSVITRCRS
ncbi:rapid alkalinization factor [Rhodamnia argentea]|uniref:Rapid alkalinization factor n=1 Tax=Rhodamnia argentea TaxID=178133 RepID=A0A8B8Q8A1_9MYRT|nr:rapid alkalinization factor [Rhodamnia argentea]